MKRFISISILLFLCQNITFGQSIELPKKILITNKHFSPWGTNLHYKYKLILRDSNYKIISIFRQEDGKKTTKNKKIGKVSVSIVKNILASLNENQSNEINPDEFIGLFSSDSINKSINKNRFIYNNFQKEYIVQQLTNPEFLKENLTIYYKDYDHSGYIDGSSTELKIIFQFENYNTTILTKSILSKGLPLEVNGEKKFSSKISDALAELIPRSKINRVAQLKGNKIFKQILSETIRQHSREIRHLGSKTYQFYIDSLKNQLDVSSVEVVNSIYSVNWDGEKRLSCVLKDTTSKINLEIHYSNPIENGNLKFPVSIILADFPKLLDKIKSIDFFKQYLHPDSDSKISIIHDGFNCFTEETKEGVFRYCDKLDLDIDFDNSLFVELRDENWGFSRWVILPNNNFFDWYGDKDITKLINNNKYLICR